MNPYAWLVGQVAWLLCNRVIVESNVTYKRALSCSSLPISEFWSFFLLRVCDLLAKSADQLVACSVATPEIKKYITYHRTLFCSLESTTAHSFYIPTSGPSTVPLSLLSSNILFALCISLSILSSQSFYPPFSSPPSMHAILLPPCLTHAGLWS